MENSFGSTQLMKKIQLRKKSKSGGVSCRTLRHWYQNTQNRRLSIFFFSGIFLICIIFLPSLFLPQNVVLYGGKIMGYWSAICLRIFLSTEIIIKGKENIIKNGKFF